MIKLFLRRLFALPEKGRVLTCREAVPMFSEFMDRELDLEMREKIREHVEVCPACRRFLKSLENTALTLRLVPSCTIPEERAHEMLDNLRAEYRRAREELDEKSSE